MPGEVRTFSSRPHSATRESGQAAVESALTLPLTIFMILGMIQLGMMLNGRMMAHYAAFRATRVGSVNFGDCQRMTHAAIAALLPSFKSYMGPATAAAAGSNTPAAKFAYSFSQHKNNTYNSASDGGQTGSIVWIFRDRPTVAQVQAVASGTGDDTNYDQYENPPMRLEVRLVYWFPMNIPFANWVMYEFYQTHFGLGTYTAMNPLMPAQKANWTGTATLRAELAAEMQARAASKQYVFPIQATYTMRMMTPAKLSMFATQHCAPAPNVAVP